MNPEKRLSPSFDCFHADSKLHCSTTHRTKTVIGTMQLTTLALSIACALPITLAARITFTIPPTVLLPNPATLPPSTHATLFRLDSTLTAPITRRNTFDFVDVTPGSYLYTVQCRDYTFPPLRVDVIAGVETGSEHVDVWQTFWGNEWGNKGEHRGSGTWARGGEGGVGAGQAVVVETKPERTKDYYQERQGCE